MASVRSIISDALTEIGVLAAGEPLSAADAALGLRRFQHQLDAWQAEPLTLYSFTRTTYALPSGTSSRTIGPSGNITVAMNPMFISAINFLVPASSQAVETPMGRMNDDQYAALSIKALSSSLPTQWFFNTGAVNGTLTFWPVISQSVTIAIYCNFGVSVPTTLDDDLVGPPGYQDAFMYSLAVRLCPPFGRSLPEGLPEMAAQAFARMQRPNLDPGLLGVDAALVPSSVGGYNILVDR